MKNVGVMLAVESMTNGISELRLFVSAGRNGSIKLYLRIVFNVASFVVGELHNVD